MFDIGFVELLVIAVVGLLVIGPQRLPETIRTLALWVGRLRRTVSRAYREIEKEVGMDEIRRQLHNEEIMRQLNSEISLDKKETKPEQTPEVSGEPNDGDKKEQ